MELGGMVGWWLEWDGREQKVGSAEKKLRLTQKNDASCVSRVIYPYLWILATTDPPRLIAFASAISKLRFKLRLSLAWSCQQYAISDGRLAPRFAFSDGGFEPRVAIRDGRFTPHGNSINS